MILDTVFSSGRSKCWVSRIEQIAIISDVFCGGAGVRSTGDFGRNEEISMMSENSHEAPNPPLGGESGVIGEGSTLLERCANGLDTGVDIFLANVDAFVGRLDVGSLEIR